jgi:hypothetical protein
MIPETVKIGAYVIKIQYTKNLITDDDNLGNFNGRTMVISIDPDMSEQLQYGTFIHEVIEAIKSIYNIDALVKEKSSCYNSIGRSPTCFIQGQPRNIPRKRR